MVKPVTPKTKKFVIFYFYRNLVLLNWSLIKDQNISVTKGKLTMLLMSLLGGHSEIDLGVLLIFDLVLSVLSMLVQ